MSVDEHPLKRWVESPDMPLVGLAASWQGQRHLHMLSGRLTSKRVHDEDLATSLGSLQVDMAALDHCDGVGRLLSVCAAKSTETLRSHPDAPDDWPVSIASALNLAITLPETDLAWSHITISVAGNEQDARLVGHSAQWVIVAALSDVFLLLEGTDFPWSAMPLVRLSDALGYDFNPDSLPPSLVTPGSLVSPHFFTLRWPRLSS